MGRATSSHSVLLLLLPLSPPRGSMPYESSLRNGTSKASPSVSAGNGSAGLKSGIRVLDSGSLVVAALCIIAAMKRRRANGCLFAPVVRQRWTNMESAAELHMLAVAMAAAAALWLQLLLLGRRRLRLPRSHGVRTLTSAERVGDGGIGLRSHLWDVVDLAFYRTGL